MDSDQEMLFLGMSSAIQWALGENDNALAPLMNGCILAELIDPMELN